MSLVNEEKSEKEGKIEELEQLMLSPDFWQDKEKAKQVIQDIQNLKDEIQGIGKYDKGDAVITIFSGAGGQDAEDFSRMLYEMYIKFIENKRWSYYILHKNENDHGGYRNITFEVDGKNVYGNLKDESGVHRLVRISPFNAKKLRHTSFSMVEVVPKFKKIDDYDLPEDELRVEFARSGGPGGQNVNKRETAVRAVHIPTNIAVHVDSERSQAQNKEKAVALLKGKLYLLKEQQRKEKEEGLYISKITDAEWGSQIRSYVLHPYKMVKDHRTGVEVRDVEKVLDGDLEHFINKV
jgi:peptide chain release factor 2